MKINTKTLAEWTKAKFAASGGKPFGEAQICQLGIDLRGYFKDEGMFCLTISWEEVAILAKEKGFLMDLSQYAKEIAKKIAKK
jgi:hypothetical protein